MRVRIATVVLFCLAGACYVTAWTALGTGLLILGVLFELCAWLSLLALPNSKKLQRSDQRNSENTSGA